MSRYFFHILDDGAWIEDLYGLELPGGKAARRELERVIEAVLSEEEWKDELSSKREFRVADSQGRVVLTVPFREHRKNQSRLAHREQGKLTAKAAPPGALR